MQPEGGRTTANPSGSIWNLRVVNFVRLEVRRRTNPPAESVKPPRRRSQQSVFTAILELSLLDMFFLRFVSSSFWCPLAVPSSGFSVQCLEGVWEEEEVECGGPARSCNF
ncbi:hypothetical protein Pcinc_040384 [Petrolisthes cinctipes]|uniref:Uncharacterized protein n=1 Tax=Petrolisthes cinctipes TaxID=88211 RepID=A0AAE1BPA7_PETCI|nr:hypothetical protein Pcinc_040384 [Petrolisthes cinctipes]